MPWWQGPTNTGTLPLFLLNNTHLDICLASEYNRWERQSGSPKNAGPSSCCRNVRLWLSASTGLLFSSRLRLKLWQKLDSPGSVGTSNFEVTELLVSPLHRIILCANSAFSLCSHHYTLCCIIVHIRFQFLRPWSVFLGLSLFLQFTPVFLLQALLR